MDSPTSRHSKKIDELTGFTVNDDFKRFNQGLDMCCRTQWDSEVKSAKADQFFEGYSMPHARARSSDGFDQRDYALRNAAWHVTNVLRDLHKDDDRKEGFFDHFSTHEEGSVTRYEFENAEQATSELKKVAEFCGADLFGVCEYDERWMYSGVYSSATQDSKPVGIPDDLNHVIVTGESMDEGLTKTVPSALSGSATGMGYSNDSVTLLTLAQYIRNLGYRAYATMNDSALAIPLAVQAGFGEVGRHSLLITEEFGPRLRLGKIFTDMPLSNSEPKQFGVKQFCEICDRCAKACPPKALPFSPPSTEIHNKSNIIGISKWSTDAEKCFKFWANQNSDCSICIRACPYNRDFSYWPNRIWRRLASGSLRRFALWLDDRFNDRGRMKSRDWWSRP